MTRPSDWRRVPFAPRLVVEPTSGRNGIGLPALTGTTDWRRRAVDRAGSLLVGAFGAALLSPSDPVVWPSAGLTELGDRLHADLPTLRLIGAALPRQVGRHRLSLLGRMAGNTVVVKVGAINDGIEHEAWVLDQLDVDPIPGIATPAPLAHGTIDLPSAASTESDVSTGQRTTAAEQVDPEQVAYLVTFGLGIGRQRPVSDAPLSTFEVDLKRRLAHLPKPDGTPDHYIPIHGDVAPYNLRRTGLGLALFDWEGAMWGPPGSDLEMYRRRCDMLRRGAPIPPPLELLEQL